MPDRDRNTMTQHVTLGDGQVNLNGMVLDVNGITFTQDGIGVAPEPIVRLNDDAEITATATWEEYDTALQRLFDLSGTPSRNGTIYAENVLRDEFRRVENEINQYTNRATSADGYNAYTYMFDNPWVTYNPYLRMGEFVGIPLQEYEREEPELDGDNARLDGFLGEFVKEAV